ncbi:hypothetical protein GIB67_027296 [Kingdonia uniflora]|uniref:Uncharacterized protein n=1 Tax=Kingdonia uniflora TaxID=39325 RepID=A0A7J7KYN3_9MAGN|nr:hypothetical protein GIB67_027296 [Kingdonia uniflora]
MLEAVNPSESLKIGILVSGVDNGDGSRKQALKYVACGTYKRRKVSAIRDFPEGCGRRLSSYVNAIPSNDGSVENMKISADGPLLGHKTVEVESQTHEISANIIKELVSPETALEYEKVLDSLTMETTEVKNKQEIFTSYQSQILLPRTFSENYPPRGRVSASRDFPLGCGRRAPCFSKEERQQYVDCSKGKEKPSGEGRSKDNMVMDDSNIETPKFLKETGDKVGGKVELDVVKKGTENIRVRNASEPDFKQDDREKTRTRIPRDTDIKVDGLIRNSGWELEDSPKCIKERSFNGKLPEEPEDERHADVTQFQEEDFNDDRVIVQGLMAAPNCPWRLGKKAPGSVSQGTSRSRVKKYEYMAHDNFNSIAKKKDEAETLKGSSAMMKKPLAKMEGQMVLYDEDGSPDYDVEDTENFQLVPRSTHTEINMIPFGVRSSLSDKGETSEAGVTRNKVRETLRLFQAVFRKLLRSEEANKGKINKRIDLESSNILKKHGKCVNIGKEAILGNVPGVEVGDEFHYRVELHLIGLHRPLQSGIDSVKSGNLLLATSIVASGGYADETDDSDVLQYSGQGGNPSGDKEAEDQKLERGNLALKNSMDANSPVRVIRGFKETAKGTSSDTKGKIVSTFIYDGLYLVESYRQEIGRKYGKNVYMFCLRRIPGQPELPLKEVKKSRKAKVREGLCVADISQGKEKRPICAVNTIDDEKPPPFKYITKIIYPTLYKPIPPKGCDCRGGCSEAVKCVCSLKNGGEIPFNHDGAIVEIKPLVYECGSSCKCPPSCPNRVSQLGITFQLEIFKTESRGWGVRSLTSIPSGSFICEYTGEFLQDTEADQRTGNDEYLFDIGNNYNDDALRGELSALGQLQPASPSATVEDVGFTIDALHYGNVGRFINHSCSPNLYAQNVLYDHDDKRMPHIMLFAAENIRPLKELTYHYNYSIGEVRDSDGNIKKKNCYCGSIDCTGRLY